MITKIWRILHHNFIAKIMALLVSIILWLVVMNDQNPTISGSYQVPVTYGNAPKGYKISRETNQVELSVKAPRSYFPGTDADDFRAVANLSGLEEGSYDVTILPQLPQGFELVEMKPESVRVKLDPFIERQFSVELITSGATAPGTTVAGIRQDTETVTVVGPKSVVDNVRDVVGYVGLSGNSTAFESAVALDAVDKEGKSITDVRIHPSTINVHVNLARGLSKKVVTVEANLDTSQLAGYQVKSCVVEPERIEVAGEEHLIGELTSLKTEPIRLSNEAGTLPHAVKIELPGGVTVTDPDVVVTVELVPVKSGSEKAP